MKKTFIDQEAVSLGATTLVFIGVGLWNEYEKIDFLHRVEHMYFPIEENRCIYKDSQIRFEELVNNIANMNK